MKRLTIVMIMLVLTAAAVGCQRGTRMWGLRGASCAAPAYPPPAPVTTSAPSVSYSPVTTSASVPSCCPATTSAPQEVYATPVPTIESIPEAVPGTVVTP